jgi:tetratricopeptide (TPR) repeat protein/predicted Ser/Thr protein kinase
MSVERASEPCDPVAVTQLPPDDSFSDVDSQIGAFVAELGAAPGPPQFIAGTLVAGHFEVIRKLGQGGMGIVFLVRDLRLDRDVAIKLVGRRSDHAMARLEREAQAMAQLSHPNVVAVHEVGQHDGSLYIAMEFVDGPTLRAWQRSERRGWREIVEAYVQAARGLAAAHGAGFVHRDFKPDNVLLGRDGRARVADFGLARTQGSVDDVRGRIASLEGSPAGDASTPAGGVARRSMRELAELTASDAVLGTPAYMAPEQFTGRGPVGPAVDQFAFGVALYEALTGLRPFGEVPNWVASDSDRVAPPRDRTMPRWLRVAVRRMLALDPAARYADMQAVVIELERGLGLARARTRWAVALVGVGAAVSLGVGLGTSTRHAPCEDAAATSQTVWNGERRERLASTFASDGASGATTWATVAPIIDGWVDAWIATRTAGCQATRVDGSQSEALLDRQVACLESRMGRVAAVLTALERDRGPRQRVDELVADLPDTAPCADPEYLLSRVAPPEDPAVREAVAAISTALVEEQLHIELGDVVGMHDRIAAVIRDADATGWAPIAARARWLAGQLAMLDGTRESAATLLREAYFTARAAGDDETAALVAMSLAYLDGFSRHERGLAEIWLDHATADIRRGAAPPRSAIAIEVTRAQILQAAGDPDAAVVALERGLEMIEQAEQPTLSRLNLQYELAAALDTAGRHSDALAVYDTLVTEATSAFGAGSQRVAMLHNNRGLAHYYLGDYAAAITDLARAIEIETALGASEIALAPARLNLGLAFAATGALDEAAAMLDRVRALWRSMPDASADVALVTKALAWVELRRRKLERARVLADEALALARQTLEPEHLEVAASAALVGDVALASGDLDTAIARLEEADRLWSAPTNADNPARIDTLVILAEAYAAAGRNADARSLLERAFHLASTSESDDNTLARAHFVRARIRRAAGEREASIADAREALRLYLRPTYATEVAAVEAWLGDP